MRRVRKMPDNNRLPEEKRSNVNENEDMTTGSSQGVAPTGGSGTTPGGSGDGSADMGGTAPGSAVPPAPSTGDGPNQ